MTVAHAQIKYRTMEPGLIALTLRTADGQTLTAPIPANYIKQRAWAILSDLDPDNAAEAKAEAKSLKHRRGRPSGRGIGDLTDCDRILLVMQAGRRAVATISDATGIGSDACSSRMHDLRTRGLIVANKPPRQGVGRNTFDLTPAGVEHIAKLLRVTR